MLGNLPINLAAGLFAGEASAWARRAKRSLIAYCFIGFFGLTAWTLLVAGSAAAAAETYGLPASLLVGALVFLCLALLLAGVLKFFSWRRRKAERERQTRNALMAAAAATVVSTGIVRSKPLLFLALAVGAGIAAGGFSLGRSQQGE